MFEESIDVPMDAVQVLTALAVSALLVVIAAGFCGGALTVSPEDFNVARFGVP